MAGYSTGKVIRAATLDELGEIRIDNGGNVINYGIDDFDEPAMKKWHKKTLEEDDTVSFKISKDGFAVDIQPTAVQRFKRPLAKSI